jgi:uncharacterized protein YjdB/tRNA A-37 threonylcarbamoyl transferase component Bud32
MVAPSKVCSACRTPVSADAAFCTSCGAPTPPSLTGDAAADALGGEFQQRLAAALAGRYRLIRELGRGGMAIVYLADDLRHERQVAIKVMRPEIAEAVGGDRFVREIKLAAKLHHPNILALHDSGDADGFLYYVMPHVAGESLRHRLQRERALSIAEALRLTREIAEALDYAHERRVVHRDIKPENVLLAGDHAYVADFGIAKAVSSVEQPALTSLGLALGTPWYMSPEQASGDPRLDGRADTYSLACVAYEMLAGEPPFTGPTVHAVMAKHALDPRPSVRTVRDTVPREADLTIQRGMAKVAADRPGSAGDFAAALRAGCEQPAPAALARRAGPARLATLGITGIAILGAVLLGRQAWRAGTGVAALSLAQPAYVLEPGDTLRLRPTARDADGDIVTPPNLAWTSGDPTVAIVTNDGLVSAVAAGTTVLVGAGASRSLSATIVVEPTTRDTATAGSGVVDPPTGRPPLDAAAAPATTPRLPPQVHALEPGDTVRLTASGQEGSAQVQWTTLDPDVVAVSPTGLALALAGGVARVRGLGARATVDVTILVQSGPPVVAVLVRDAPDSLVVRGTSRLRAVLLDETGSAIAGDVRWWSSDSTIAHVDSTGTVTARRPGVVTVVAAVGRKRSSTVSVVVAGGETTVVDLALSPRQPVPLRVRERLQLTARGLGPSGQPLDVPVRLRWTSSDPTVVTVTPTGLVTAVSPGAARITVASGHLRRAVSIAVQPTLAQASAADPAAAIGVLLRQWALAIESRDPDFLRQVYPTIADALIRQTFKAVEMMEDLKVLVSLDSLSRSGDSATVHVSTTFEFNPPPTRRALSAKSVWTIARGPRGWEIIHID